MPPNSPGSPRTRHRRTRRRRSRLLVGTLAFLSLASAGSVAALAYTRTTGRGTPTTVVTTPTAGQAAAAVRAFGDAWSRADASEAGRTTDQPMAARAALGVFHSGLQPVAISVSGITVGAPDPSVTHAVRTDFQVRVTLHGARVFAYAGSADVRVINGLPLVDWSPGVLYPDLTDAQHLALVAVPAVTAQVADRHGLPLSARVYPSLAMVIASLQHTQAQRVQRSAGTAVAVVDSAGRTVRVLKNWSPAVPGTVTTTLDAVLQATAERAVQDPHIGTMPADVVAVDYTDGQIRAIAFRGGDAALSGAAAPGSTMKIITSAALFDKAGANPTDPVPCPTQTVIAGQTFHNFQGESSPNAELIRDFAISCNTAFIDAATSSLHSGDLREEARDVFGLGDWKIGVPTVDGDVPDENGSTNLLAAQSIGQGKVTMNPLAMAAVVATVADGAFHQPILLPGLPQQPARRSISAGTAAAIRQMMRVTATAPYGTARPRMRGIDGGAKTGTAETSAGTNGWFAAYDTTNHLAVDALVVGGKEGVLSAGYVARDVLANG